eukprot:scaffold438_cov250-Pinguiococcus_pyrenoidosus.AAC.9
MSRGRRRVGWYSGPRTSADEMLTNGRFGRPCDWLPGWECGEENFGAALFIGRRSAMANGWAWSARNRIMLLGWEDLVGWEVQRIDGVTQATCSGLGKSMS